MPERKRSANIGIYPRVFGFPFTLGLTFLGVLIFSAFAAALALNIFVFLIPTITCYVIIRRLKKKYGDFYAQKSQITRYELYKSRAFIMQLRYNLIADKEEKNQAKH